MKSKITVAASPNQRAYFAWISVFFIAMTVRLIYYVSHYSVNILFWDQWESFSYLFGVPHSWLDSFQLQHNGTRMGMSLWLDEWIAHLSHWNSRWEAMAVAGGVVVTAAVALILKWRLFKKWSYLDVVIPLAILSLSQWESYFGAASFAGGVFPLLFVLMIGLALTIDSFVWKWIWILLFNLLLIYSSYGYIMGFLIPWLICWEIFRQPTLNSRRSGVLILALGISLAAIGIFFMGITPYYVASLHSALRDKLIFFACLMLNPVVSPIHDPWGFLASLFIVGIAAALLFNAKTLLRQGQPKPRVLICLLFLTYTLVFALLCTWGRAALGAHTGASSRYVPYIIPAYLAFYFWISDLPSLRKNQHWLGGMAILLLLSAEFCGRGIELRNLHSYYSVKSNWKACYLALEDVALCNQRVGHPVYPEEGIEFLKPRLAYLKKHSLNLFYSND